jgi:tetratricopeptide (TPR) repeat protein
MREDTAVHPDLFQLTGFGQGRLSVADSTKIEIHLTSCETCRQTLEAIPPDPFIKLLRAAADPTERPSLSLHFGYEIVGELGRGGMGIVYRARQIGLNRIVALKMIRYGPDASPAAVARFRREAEAVARLQHPNVVQVYEVGEQHGQPFLALELVEGPSLSEKLGGGPLSPRPAARLVAILARAVDHAHARGIIHRDLKPANVLLEIVHGEWGPGDETPESEAAASFPTVKVTDFGLAKHLYAGGPGPTETGAVLGSPCYMAPEQAAGLPEHVGPATDIYALGAILYECLTGRPPFHGATAMETLRQVADDEPVAVRQLQPRVAVELETICHKCLRKEPAGRYASAAALADDLERFLRGEPVMARPAGRAERFRKWARRKPAVAALLTLLAVIPPAAGLAVAVHVARLRAEVQRAESAAAEATRQQLRADRNYRMARDALGQMLDQLQGGEYEALPRLTELQAKQAESALVFFEAAARDADGTDPATRMDTARACERAGELAIMLNRVAAARDHLLRAVELLDGLVVSGDGIDCRELQANCLGQLGYSYSVSGDTRTAEGYQKQALALYEALAREQGGGPTAGLAWINHALGVDSLTANRLAEAEKYFRRSADLRRERVRQAAGPVSFNRLGGGESLVNLIFVYSQMGRHDQARAAFQTAEELLRPLLDEPVMKTKAALALAAAGENLADLSCREGKVAEAIDRCTQALALAEPVLRREPELEAARSYVLNLHGTRGQANRSLDRYHAAVEDYDRVVDLADAASRDHFRVTRVALLTYGGENHRARTEADDLVDKAKLSDADVLILALAYGLLAQAEKNPAAAQEAGDRAIELLRRLLKAGFFKDKSGQQLLRNASELDSLRSRKEFQQLLQPLPIN